MTVRELGRTIRSDSHKTWNMVERLREAGLVVKRDVPGHRKVVALNKRLGQRYFLLVDLLRAIDRRWPVSRVAQGRLQPRHVWEGEDGVLNPDRLDRVFQSPVRSRTLLFVAAAGVTNMTILGRSLGLDTVSALYAVNHWEREGVVRSRMAGRHRLVRLEPKFEVAEPLRRFLAALVRDSKEFQDLAEAARPDIEAILSR